MWTRLIRALTPEGSWQQKESRISIAFGRLLTVLAVVMCAVWCTKKESSEKYLGGIEFYNHDKIFNLHPLGMVVSMLFCLGFSLTAFREGWSHKVSKRIHLAFNVAAKLFMIVGLRSAYIYRDEPEGSDSTYHFRHFTTMHSWIGLTTSLLLFQQDIIGGIVFIYPLLFKVPSNFIKRYKEYHPILGKTAFVMAAVAMITGIVAKNEHLGCTIPTSSINQNPFNGYDHIPHGCQLSNGLGLVIIISVFFIVFGLRQSTRSNNGDASPLLTTLKPEEKPESPPFDRESFM